MHFCTNCGTQLDDSQQFCTGCGAKQTTSANNTQNNTQSAPNYNAAYTQPQYNPAPAPKLTGSTWDGGVLDTIANSIVASIIIGLTCGIATPWAICYMMKFVIGHVIVDGRRLRFDGNGAQLFGNWIKWFLLTIVTCGIYSFWVTPRLYKWIASHTHFE